MADTSPLAALSEHDVAIWLDDLSRDRLNSGSLRDLIDNSHVVGVTTNPTIFAKALSAGSAYDEQIAQLRKQGASVEDAVTAMTTDDVRRACDEFADVHSQTGGKNGRVSIEVDPRLAKDTEGTIEQARKLWTIVDRPNVMIKIPATQEGLPAITAAIAEGISVNVTLIFSLDRYRAVIGAYQDGLEAARRNGVDLSTIRSVASFFVSRVDSAIDPQLDEDGSDEAAALRGKAALANARLAYQTFETQFSTERWADLAASGANVQRPLWASTGVKDKAYSNTMYVDELVAPNTVNTMPEATLDAARQDANITGNTITGTYEESAQVLEALERRGVSLRAVTDKLEADGVASFASSWEELLEAMDEQLKQAGGN